MLRPRGRGQRKGFWERGRKKGLFFSGSFLGFGCGIMDLRADDIRPYRGRGR